MTSLSANAIAEIVEALAATGRVREGVLQP